MQTRVEATYWLESPHPLEKAAEVIAGEQSSGTFVEIPGETADLKARFRARVESVETLNTAPAASLTGKYPPGARFNQGRVRLSWSMENFGPSLPNLLSTVSGNLWELQEVSGLRLLKLALPADFARRYAGPQFGAPGTRALSGVQRGPLVGTIIKPSVGMTPEQTAKLVEELCDGGIDFIKDDELMGDAPHCPFNERVSAVLDVIARHAERTGRKVMYAANITDDVDRMLANHDFVHAHGGTCVMVSVNSVGFSGLAHVRRHSRLPIHAHRTGWGLFARSPGIGWDFGPWQALARLAGADHVHVCGLRNKFWEADESVIASARECLAPLFDDGPAYRAMPVFSSAQWAEQAKQTFDATGTDDLIYTAGGGIVAHPGGVAAGVRAIRHAWEGAVSGLSLEQVAQQSREVRESIAKFGKKKGQA
jgi:ribulose-bisphosphate carboxylase large chain